MVQNNFLFIGLVACFLQFKSVKPMILNIKDPDGKSIYFQVIEHEERVRLINSEIVKLYKIDKDFFNKEIFLLKNGDFLHIYTADAYVFRFNSEDDLNRFINNGDHFPASIIRDKENGKFYYQFSLFSHKSLEFIKKCVKEIPNYPSKFDKKLYLLDDGTYLRASKRDTVNVIYDANWFPDIESFEWFYNHQMCD